MGTVWVTPSPESMTMPDVQREDRLDGDVEGGDAKGLEHDLGHALAVGLGVERGLSEQDRVVLRVNTQFRVESVVPDLLHVVPVGDDAVLQRVFDQQHAATRHCRVADVLVLLARADHDALGFAATIGRVETVWVG
jgi:hypothetical protein